MHFVEQKISTLIKTKRNRKWKIPHIVLERRTLCFSSYKNRKLKVKLWWVGAHKRKERTYFVPLIYYFFLSAFSFTDTDDSQDSRGREGIIFYSTLPLPPAHKHSDIYLQLCTWDDYHIFLFLSHFYFYRIFITIYRLFCPKEIFLTFVYSLSQCIVYWIRFQNIHAFIYQKTLLHTFFCLFWKSLKAFSVCLSRPYHFKFFKGCLPQIWLGPFLNTLSHIRFFWSRCYSDWIWIFTRYCP